MEMEPVKRAVVRRRVPVGEDAGEWPDELVDTLHFHELLFEEMSREMSLMADIIMAMDAKMDLLEAEVVRARRSMRFPRLGSGPCI